MDAKRTKRLLGNCHSKWWKQYPSGSTATTTGSSSKVWAKLTPESIIDLLDNCAFGAKFEARQILVRMEQDTQNPWQIRATAHFGGTGDARGGDDNLHITLKAGGISYHLRCKEAPRLHITQITR
jgi:hypothetical protein